MIKECIYCQAEIKPVEGFFKQAGEEDYKEMRENFKKEFGFDLKKSKNFNCLSCGQVYDKSGNPLQFKLGWLQ